MAGADTPGTSSTDTPTRQSSWIGDILASIVVFMVALPLCIGIAQASGMPPEAGIITGIVGGLIVGSFAGSPLQVSGPAAGLIVLVLQFLDSAKASVTQDGLTQAEILTRAIPILGLAILLAGAIQILAGVFRLGQWFRAVSPAVVEGMLAGIGVTIIAKQFYVLIDDAPPKGIVEGLLMIPNAIGKAIQPPDGATSNHSEAALIGLIAIVILATWKFFQWKWLKFVPAAVVAIAVALALNEFGRPLFDSWGWRWGPATERLGGLGVDRVVVSSNLVESMVFVTWPGSDPTIWALILKGAVTFALIASAETLLCAVAVDSKHNGPRTKFNQELIAQGIGNMTCGAVGALPMTGVIVRSSANLDAGAKTRLSAILHGLWLLLLVALLPGVLSRIPVSALAAVLVFTGWKLLNVPGLVKLWKLSRPDALIFLATAGTIVSVDLLAGVMTGIALAAARLLWTFSTLKVTRTDDPATQSVTLDLEGAATFIRLPILAQALDAIPAPGTKLLINLDQVRLVDHSILELLETFQKQFVSKGGKVELDHDRLEALFQTPTVTSR